MISCSPIITIFVWRYEYVIRRANFLCRNHDKSHVICVSIRSTATRTCITFPLPLFYFTKEKEIYQSVEHGRFLIKPMDWIFILHHLILLSSVWVNSYICFTQMLNICITCLCIILFNGHDLTDKVVRWEDYCKMGIIGGEFCMQSVVIHSALKPLD